MSLVGPTEIGASVRNRRRRLGLTQQDLAEMVGVSRRLVSEVERGSERASLRTVRALCEAVGIELATVPRYGTEGHSS